MSPELDLALARAAEADVLLVACDFDGTLSPIVADPSQAAPDSAALVPLYGLGTLVRTVAAIISGRSLDDLRRRLGAPPPGLELIGSHGAEDGSPGGDHLRSDLEPLYEVLQLVVDRFPGAEVETKPFSAALHYRRVAKRDQNKARRAALQNVPEIVVEIREGKKVVEFMAVPADKGTALRRLRDRCGTDAVVFMGDDVTDEAAFLALASGDVGVKVGPEPTAAAHRVTSRDEVASVLSRLLEYRSAHLEG